MKNKRNILFLIVTILLLVFVMISCETNDEISEVTDVIDKEILEDNSETEMQIEITEAIEFTDVIETSENISVLEETTASATAEENYTEVSVEDYNKFMQKLYASNPIYEYGVDNIYIQPTSSSDHMAVIFYSKGVSQPFSFIIDFKYFAKIQELLGDNIDIGYGVDSNGNIASEFSAINLNKISQNSELLEDLYGLLVNAYFKR